MSSSIVDASGDTLDLNNGTKVRIGLVFSVVVAIGSCYSWLDSRFTRIESSIRIEAEQTASTMRAVEAAASDRWTRTDQRLLLLEFKIRNPKMDIPLIAASK